MLYTYTVGGLLGDSCDTFSGVSILYEAMKFCGICPGSYRPVKCLTDLYISFAEFNQRLQRGFPPTSGIRGPVNSKDECARGLQRVYKPVQK